MPSSAYNTTPIYQPEKNSKPWHKGKKRKFLILFVLIVFAAAMAYITTQTQYRIPSPFSPPKVDTENIVNTETGELTEETLKNVRNITIEEIREASESTGINPLQSPTLSEEETQNRIYREIGNSEPENHFVSYSDFGLSLPVVEVKQGDTVTWSNDSTAPMTVVGAGWQSQVPRDQGDQFSQVFFFLGEYKYTINGQIEGIVTVVQ